MPVDDDKVFADGHAGSPTDGHSIASTVVGSVGDGPSGGVSGNENPAVCGQLLICRREALLVDEILYPVLVHWYLPCCRAQKLVVRNVVTVVRMGRSQRRIAASS